MDNDSTTEQVRALGDLINSAIGLANTNNTYDVLESSELSEVLPKGEAPEYYKETAVVDRHKLTAVKGQLHALVWHCRICGETAANSGVFREVACDG